MPIVIFAVIIISAITGGSYIADGGDYLYSKIPLFGKKNEQSITISPTPTQQPTPTSYKLPSSTPKPVVKGVKTSYITTDPDPIIDCTFTYLGTKQLKRSECNISFECEIDSKWYLYTSRDKCKQDQSSYWSKYYDENSPPDNNLNSTPLSIKNISCVINGEIYMMNNQENCDSARSLVEAAKLKYPRPEEITSKYIDEFNESAAKMRQEAENYVQNSDQSINQYMDNYKTELDKHVDELDKYNIPLPTPTTDPLKDIRGCIGVSSGLGTCP